MSKKNLTRREFLSTTAAAAAAGVVYLNAPESLAAKTDSKTRVVLIRNENVFDKNSKINETVIQKMLDDSVSTLVGASNAKDSWVKIIKPDDIVGIKSNVWSYLPTPPELEKAIKKRVLECGVKEENISIKDRGVLRDPVFKNSTAIINTRPMRTHYWSGVGSLIKNHIMFVDNPSAYHGDSCADLAKIWKLPVLNNKTRLNILVMLTPLFHSVGPHGYSKQYTWSYNGLIAGIDPVAVDTIGLKIIEAKRKEYFQEDRPLSPPAKHIPLADTRHKLGTSDMSKIELIKLGYEQGVLI